ncbi:MAG: quinone oxidoreductase [Betaproteobacteria bacterium]
MRAIRIHRFGGPEVIELNDVAVPEPTAGQLLIKMAYAGVNFSDIYRRGGDYANSPTYSTPLPYVLGVEGSGTVAKLGSGVTGFAIGDRVAYTRNSGSYAEYSVAPAIRLAHVPDGVSLEVASAILTHGMTAHYLSTEFGLAKGNTALVHAGAGGVGQMLIQMLKMRGVRVIATVGTDAKAEIARNRGADDVIVYTRQNFSEETRRLTAGRGVDVVFDSVGKDTLHGSLHSLRRRGTCVLFGHSSGLVKNFEPMELAEAGSVLLTRTHMEHFVATPDEFARRAKEVMKWVADGALRVTIQQVFDLADAGKAHAILENRGTVGKLLLKIAV